MEKIENHCPLSSTSHEGLTLPLLASVTWCFSADFAKPLALIQILLNGPRFYQTLLSPTPPPPLILWGIAQFVAAHATLCYPIKRCQLNNVTGNM